MPTHISNQTITVTTNHWRVPSVENAFDGWLEGQPSPEERLRVIEKVKAERAGWKPNREALELVQQLLTFVGYRVRIEFWDPNMVMFDDEAPFPTEADCLGVSILEEDGFPQAYIEVTNIQELPTPDGYTSRDYFVQSKSFTSLLAPLSWLYRISRFGPPRGTDATATLVKTGR